MKLLFVSDSFKGSLSSSETAALLTKAAKEVFGSCTCMSLPVADGGEGTVEAVTAATHGKIITAEVHDPLMRRIKARYGVTGSKAVIEMAAASGLPLLSEKERDPLSATTYGTGELIRDALRRGCREITVAIGGSATNDGGMGCVRALGGKFFDKDGRELSGCGRDLTAVYRIALDGLEPLLREAAITVLCDVKNPLCGANGATRRRQRAIRLRQGPNGGLPHRFGRLGAAFAGGSHHCAVRRKESSLRRKRRHTHLFGAKGRDPCHDE